MLECLDPPSSRLSQPVESSTHSSTVERKKSQSKYKIGRKAVKSNQISRAQSNKVASSDVAEHETAQPARFRARLLLGGDHARLAAVVSLISLKLNLVIRLILVANSHTIS